MDHENIVKALDAIIALNVQIDAKQKEQENRNAITEVKKTINNLGVFYINFAA